MIVENSHKVQLKRERVTITCKLQWLNMMTKGDKGGYILISAKPQRQTSVKGCRIFGDLDQLQSRYHAKNVRLILTAKRGKEIKQQ